MKAITKIIMIEKALNEMEKMGVKRVPVFAVKELIKLAGMNLLAREALEKIVQDQTGWDREKLASETKKTIIEIKENINPKEEVQAMKDVMMEVEAMISITQRGNFN